MTRGAGGLSLKARAIAWLAQREHSRAELERKLHALCAAQRRARGDASNTADTADTADVGNAANAALSGPSSAPDPLQEVPALLDWLEQRGYLSDRRYAESRVRARASRYGLQRLQQELAQQGVALDDDLRQGLRESELQRAAALAQRRYGDTPAADAAEQAKRLRYLIGRGFAHDVARRALQRRDG